jgi:hypothetical protein
MTMDVSRIRRLEVARGTAPEGTVKLTAAVQITAKETRFLLYAQRMNDNSHVMECGVIPHHPSEVTWEHSEAADVSAVLKNTLRACLNTMRHKSGGNPVFVDRVFVDYGWHASSGSVMRVCDSDEFRTWVVLCRSRFQPERPFEVTSQSVPAVAILDLDHWRTVAAKKLYASRLSVPAGAASDLLNELPRWHAIEVFSGRASRRQWVLSMGPVAGMFDLLAMAVAAAEVQIRVPVLSDVGDGLYPAKVKLQWDQYDHADGLKGRKWFIHRAPSGFEAWLNDKKLYSFCGHAAAIDFCERDEARLQRFDIELAQVMKEKAFMREASERMNAESAKAAEAERNHEELWKRYSETLRKHEEFIAAAAEKGCDAVLLQADDAMEVFRAAVELTKAEIDAGHKPVDTVIELCDLFSDRLLYLRRKLERKAS